MLYWLHIVTRARRPGDEAFVRWLVAVGAGLTAVMAITYTVIVANKAHTFVTTGDQSYPEANHLTSSGLVVVLPLLLELGTLLLAIGVILTSLSAMRVGLVTRTGRLRRCPRRRPLHLPDRRPGPGRSGLLARRPSR